MSGLSSMQHERNKKSGRSAVDVVGMGAFDRCTEKKPAAFNVVDAVTKGLSFSLGQASTPTHTLPMSKVKRGRVET